MKIALVAPPYFAIPPRDYGGIEAVVADLADGLVARGHEVTLLCAGPSATRACEIRVLDAPRPDRLGDPLAEVAYAAAAARIIAELAAGGGLDVVHDHTVAGPLTAGGRAVPTVATCHGEVGADARRMYADLAGAIGLVAISRRQRELAPELPWVGTVYNAVRVEDFPLRETPPAEGGYALFLGRMSPDKGPHLALEAAHEAGLRLILAGKCSHPDELTFFESEVRPRLRAGDQVVGLADSVRKRELLVAARCLLMPIRWEEPFGMVMIEAAACGTPVVALRAGAVPEIIVDGVTGAIRTDPAELPAAIEAVGALDPRECRAHVAAHFSVERMAEGYEQAYAAAVAGAPQAAQRQAAAPDQRVTVGRQGRPSDTPRIGVAALQPAAP